jgi:hypothetical protein
MALKRRVRLLGNAQTQGHFALGQPGLLSEGLEQRGQLLGSAQVVIAHTVYKLWIQFTDHRLFSVSTDLVL